MSKNSDRAFIERGLEDAMNNDWRLFRAQLVAQEKAEQEKEEKNGGTTSGSHSSDGNGVDQEVARQGQLSDLFAGAIQNIFKSSSSSSKGSAAKENNASKKQEQRHYTDEELFLGHGIGASAGSSSEAQASDNGAAADVTPQDPFATVAELPLWLSPSAQQVSKHRWAHEISHLEPGCVLLANEKLGGVFHQTVVLIIEHHETTGTFGVVINRYVRLFGKESNSCLGNTSNKRHDRDNSVWVY